VTSATHSAAKRNCQISTDVCGDEGRGGKWIGRNVQAVPLLSMLEWSYWGKRQSM